MGRYLRHVAPVELHRAAVRQNVAGDKVEQRRFARAIRPGDAQRLPLRDVKRHIVSDLQGREIC